MAATPVVLSCWPAITSGVIPPGASGPCSASSSGSTAREALKDVALEVYAQLANLHGSYDFEARRAARQDEKELARYTLGARMHAHDPRRSAAAGLPRHALSLPTKGKYAYCACSARQARLCDLVLWALARRARTVARRADFRRRAVTSAGPDAVHLCLRSNAAAHLGAAPGRPTARRACRGRPGGSRGARKRRLRGPETALGRPPRVPSARAAARPQRDEAERFAVLGRHPPTRSL